MSKPSSQFRLYNLLEVEPDASMDDIKKSYRKLVLKYHPDKNPSKEASEQFQAIFEAYKVLSDEHQRSLYDQFGDDDYKTVRDFGVGAKMLTMIFSELSFILVVPFEVMSKRAKTSPPNTWSLRQLWSGTPMGVFSAVVYDLLRDYLMAYTGHQAFTLLASQFICYPLELITTLHKTGTVHSWSSGCKEAWNNGLFRGFVPYFLHDTLFVLCDILINSSRLIQRIEEKVRSLVSDKGQGVALAANVGLVVGKLTLLTLITCPLKTLVVRSQCSKSGFFGSWSMGNQGWGNLYRGFWSDVLFYTGTSFINMFVKQ